MPIGRYDDDVIDCEISMPDISISFNFCYANAGKY